MDVSDRREALVLIDLQEDYFADDELSRCRDDLVAACNDLVRAARETDVPVIEVRTVHEHDGSTWTLNMREDGQGMALRGTPGVAPLDGLDNDDALVVEKTRDNAFFGTDLRRRLEEQGIDHLVLCGVSTESCVAATAIDAFAHDLGVTLVSDATASVDRDLHDDTLAQLADRYRQDVETAAEVEARWREPAARTA
jgi:nicotinamidase-related amidase